jgi:hypothetical protein
MGIPVAELQQRITSTEFGDYLELYERRPFGPRLASPMEAEQRDPKDVVRELKSALRMAEVMNG